MDCKDQVLKSVDFGGKIWKRVLEIDILGVE